VSPGPDGGVWAGAAAASRWPPRDARGSRDLRRVPAEDAVCPAPGRGGSRCCPTTRQSTRRGGTGDGTVAGALPFAKPCGARAIPADAACRADRAVLETPGRYWGKSGSSRCFATSGSWTGSRPFPRQRRAPGRTVRNARTSSQMGTSAPTLKITVPLGSPFSDTAVDVIYACTAHPFVALVTDSIFRLDSRFRQSAS